MENLAQAMLELKLDDWTFSEWAVMDCLLVKSRKAVNIVKEISFNTRSLRLKEPLTFLISSPRLANDGAQSFRPDSDHGLKWADGNVRLSYAGQLIIDLLEKSCTSPIRTVIVASEEQQQIACDLLYRYGSSLYTVINIEKVGLAPFPDVWVNHSVCLHHGNQFNKNNRLKCAQANVKLMMLWLMTRCGMC